MLLPLEEEEVKMLVGKMAEGKPMILALFVYHCHRPQLGMAMAAWLLREKQISMELVTMPKKKDTTTTKTLTLEVMCFSRLMLL